MIFNEHEEDALDYVILRDGGLSLYLDQRYLEEDTKLLIGKGYGLHTLDCSTWHSESAFHASISKALSFPGYYGNNLDALNDVMCDLAIDNRGGLVLVLLAYDKFAHRSFPLAEAVLDIFSRASHRFLLNGKRFVVMVQSSDPRLTLPKLGGCVPAWNRREWRLQDRGL